MRQRISASIPIGCRSLNGLDEGIMARRRRLSAAAAGRSVPEAIIPEPAFEIFAFDTEVVGGGRCASRRMPTSRFRSSACSRRSRREHARRVPDEPEQPDRRARCRSRRSGRSRARVPPGRSCSWTRPTPSSPAQTFIPELAAFPERRRRPHVLEGVRPGGPAHRRDHRRIRTRSSRFGWRCRSTASTSPRSSPCRRRSRTATTCDDYLRAGRESKALLYAACDRLGLDVLEERRQLRARRRRRRARRARATARRRAASTCAIARPNPAAPAACASPPASSSTRGAASTSSRRSCAPRGNRSPDDRDADRADARARRQGPLRRAHRHPVSRSHAGAVRAPRRVRPEGQGDRRPRRRSASHRRGSRHRARRSGVAGARRPPRHQPRRLLRDADGRNAGRGRDRSRRPAAHGRRSEGEASRASAICRPSWCTISSKGSRSARAPTCTSR